MKPRRSQLALRHIVWLFFFTVVLLHSVRRWRRDEFAERRARNLRIDISRGFVIDAVDTTHIAGSGPAAAAPEIFVSIVSYRDDVCAYTLRSLFANALHPSRVRVVLVEQHDAASGDRPCVVVPRWATAATAGRHNDSAAADSVGEAVLAHPNLRLIRMHARHARGPAHARAVAAQLLATEEFYLQVDSHMKFAPRWDERLLLMHAALVAEHEREGRDTRPVLGYHPPQWVAPRPPHFVSGGVEALEPDEERFATYAADDAQALVPPGQQPAVCRAIFERAEHGFPVLYGALVPLRADGLPREQPFIGAGLLFAEAQVIHSVPLDPYLGYLFHGEEVLYSARLWTSGCDLYAPSVEVAWHLYMRSARPRFNPPSLATAPAVVRRRASANKSDGNEEDNNGGGSDDASWEEEQRSVRRVQFLLGAVEYVPPRKRGESPPAPLVADAEQAGPAVDLYGLGEARTLRQYWRFSGLDMADRTFDERRWGCGLPDGHHS